MNTFRSVLCIIAFYCISAVPHISAQVVISEVYGGGGNSGSLYKTDFIELYNPTDSVISVNGWSVQYTSTTATGTWKITYLTGSIGGHRFYLVQEAAGSGGTSDLPIPDVSGTINLSATGGKVALCSTTIPLFGVNPARNDLIDFVGFGSANFYEGTGPAPAPSNSKSIERKASSTSTAETMDSTGVEEFLGNGFDSNDNSNDFLTRAPQPQNSESRTESLSADITPPFVDSVKVLSSTQIEICFQEAVDSLSSSTASNYAINKALIVTQAQRDTLNWNRVLLTVPQLSNDFYTLTIQNVKDIAGNEMTTPATFSFTFGILTLAQARSAGVGTVVRVRGVVTAADEFISPSFIQDTTDGLAVFSQSFIASARVGDMWEVEGVLKYFNGLLGIDSLTDTVRLSSDNPLPMPKTISAEQVGELYESQLICVTGVSFSETGLFTGGTSGTTYHIMDGVTRLDVRIPNGSELEGAAIPAGVMNLKGILGRYYARFQIMPRNQTDLEQLPGPVIDSPPKVSALSDTSFTVSWTTSEPGHSYISFGITPVFDDSIGTPISALVTSHSVTVFGRKPGRLYYFRAATINNSGTSFSATYPVVTTSPQSSGQMEAYFNYSVDETLGLQPEANGSVDLQTKLLERISLAGNSIDLALYSFDDFSSSEEVVAARVADSLIAAKNRGVAVRMVFDDKQTPAPLQKLIDAGIPVQKRNLISNNGIMHNKFIIFDGRDTASAFDDWVLSGSWNVTNSGTYDDAQNALFIQDQSLARIYTMEFEEMFGSSGESANPTLARFGPAKQDNTPRFTVIQGTRVEVCFSPSGQTTSRIIETISSGDKDIFFGVMSFTRNDIAQAFISKHMEGVRVHGIINDQSGSVLGTLQSSSVDALQAGHSVVTGLFHHKYCVVDPFNDTSDPLVITGSHNWSTNAETDNDENTLIIHSGSIARQYVQEFSERYKESGGSGILTGIEKHGSNIPERCELSQNYPNPFNPTTVIVYSVGTYSYTSLRVYDVLGREAAILVNEAKPAGTYSVQWDASKFASGVYFCRLSVVPSGGSAQSTKKILIRKMSLLK